MELSNIVSKITQKQISKELYEEALHYLKQPICETYTLQEYTGLLYIIGTYKEIKGLSTYCGLRIDQVISKNMYKITKENLILNEYVEAFSLETKEKINHVMKLIERRFINFNLILFAILILILTFVFRQNIFITLVVTIFTFILNYFLNLKRIKKKYIDTQIIELQKELFEDFKKFEEEIY